MDYTTVALAVLTLMSVLIGLGTQLVKAQAQHNTLVGKLDAIASTVSTHESVIAQVRTDVNALKAALH